MSIRYKVLVAEDEVKIREILVDFLGDYFEVIELSLKAPIVPLIKTGSPATVSRLPVSE